MNFDTFFGLNQRLNAIWLISEKKPFNIDNFRKELLIFNACILYLPRIPGLELSSNQTFRALACRLLIDSMFLPIQQIWIPMICSVFTTADFDTSTFARLDVFKYLLHQLYPLDPQNVEIIIKSIIEDNDDGILLFCKEGPLEYCYSNSIFIPCVFLAIIQSNPDPADIIPLLSIPQFFEFLTTKKLRQLSLQYIDISDISTKGIIQLIKDGDTTVMESLDFLFEGQDGCELISAIALSNTFALMDAVEFGAIQFLCGVLTNGSFDEIISASKAASDLICNSNLEIMEAVLNSPLVILMTTSIESDFPEPVAKALNYLLILADDGFFKDQIISFICQVPEIETDSVQLQLFYQRRSKL